MPDAYLIDGYNVVFYRSRLQRDCPPHRLRKARESFQALLVKFRAETEHAVTVVFDGLTEPDGVIPARSFDGQVEIIYSHAGQTADESIRQLLEKRAEKHRPIVVTSDRELAASAKMRSATVMSAADFLDLAAEETGGSLAKPGEKANPQIDKDVRAKREGIAPGEVDGWMKYFGLEEGEEPKP